MKEKVILVTGASGGIGFCISKLLIAQGHKVYATTRKADSEKINELKNLGVNIIELDVTSDERCKKCVEELIKKEKRIDVLINNAGYGYYGPIETVEIDEAKKQLEVNVFGLVRMTKLVLPYMRENKSGKIINISSVAGRVTTYLGGWYHASKYAVETLSNSLRMELKEFGIDVVLIEPGAIASNWGIIAADNLESSTKNTVYEKNASHVVNAYRKMYDPKNKIISSPELVAKKVNKAVKASRPKARYAFGFGAKALIFSHALLPTRMFDCIMKNMYKGM